LDANERIETWILILFISIASMVRTVPSQQRVNFTKQLNCGWNGLSSKVDLKNKENIKSLAAIHHGGSNQEVRVAFRFLF